MNNQKFSIIAFFLFVCAFLFGFLLQNPGLIISTHLTAHPDEVYNFARPVYSWLECSYFSCGIVRRGFLGTVFSPFPEPLRHALFIITFVGSYVAVFVMAIKLATVNKHTSFVLKVCLLLYTISPAGAMNLGWLLGYFETINYSILFMVIFLLFRDKIFLASLLLSIGILIHESFLFIGVPLAFGMLMDREKNKYSKISTLLIVPFFLSIYLLLYGNSDVSAMGAYRASLITPMPFSLIEYLVSGVFLGAMFFLHIRIFKKMELPKNTLFFAPYAGLALFLFGVDYMRWISIIFVSLIASVFIAVLVYRKQISNEQGLISLSKSEGLALAVCAFPFFGPLGNTDAFLALRQFLTMVGVG